MAGTKIVMAMNGNWMLHNKIHFDGSQGRLPLNLSYSIQNSKSVSRRKFRVKQQKGKQTAAETIEFEETVLDYKASSGIKLMALVAVRNTNDKAFANNFLSIFKPQNHSQGGIVLQLVSTELDPRSMEPKLGKETVLNLTKDHKLGDDGRISTYKVQFLVDPDFGVLGAVTVVNCYDREFFLESINIVQDSTVHFTCKSWVQSNKLDPDKRRFFISKAYLPCETPNGVKELREKELRQLRGDGKGRRLSYNRIYDYEVYNDLGDPDKGEEYARPTLGGQHNPHPTRCRTGPPSTKSDPKLESRASESEPIYVPRDEEYEDIKLKNIDQGKLMGVLRNVVPALKDRIMGSEVISNIDYYIKEPPKKSQLGQGAILAPLLSRILLNFRGAIGEFFKFDAPKTFSREKSHLLLDDEFGRQVLAGLKSYEYSKAKGFPTCEQIGFLYIWFGRVSIERGTHYRPD